MAREGRKRVEVARRRRRRKKKSPLSLLASTPNQNARLQTTTK
jgi:hypothetical protein